MGEEKAMSYAGSNLEQIDNAGARQFEVNVEVPEKPVESVVVEQSHPVQVGEPAQEAAKEQVDEKLDLWMKSVKEFIRNIDVKSL